MQHSRHPQFVLILSFLGIIASVPLIQSVLEIQRGESPQALELFRLKPTARNLHAYERRLEDASWVAEQFRPWAQYAQFCWFQDGGAKALIGRQGWLFYRPGMQYLTERPGLQKTSSTVSEAVTAIIDFRDQLAGRGIRLLVVPAPNKESVYPAKLTRRAAHLHQVIGPETRELVSRLRTAGVEFVDLFELFAEKAGTDNASTPLYLSQDSHWSPAGVETAAKAVARRILDRGWVKAGAVSYEVKASPAQRLGDIVRMLQAPQLERAATQETVPCFQVVRSDTRQLYRDDAASEILVLGDSFLRIYESDEPGAAGFIAHLARELGKPVTSLVNDGGASTLVRQELNRRPAWLANKKLVIWEFVERDIRLGTEGWQRVPLPPAGTDRSDEAKESL